MNNSSCKIVNNVFDNLYHPEGHVYKLRLFSRETTRDGKPIVEIQPDETRTKLYLKFIRSTPVYTFNKLMSDFVCYAEKEGYKSVELEDDALFNENGCEVRALYKRAFQNKPSLYVSKGFQSTFNIQEMISTIYNFKITDAKNMISILLATNKIHPDDTEYIKLILEIDPELNDRRLGEWLLNQSCSIYRSIFNRFGTFKGIMQKELNSGDRTKIENINKLTPESKQFIMAFCDFIKAHEHLIRKAECTQFGGYLRRKSVFTQSKQRKQRKSRKSKRNCKTIKKRAHIK